MSSIASFFLLNKQQLRSLDEIANNPPAKKSQKDRKGKRAQNVPYDLIWDYLHENGKQPYQYNWSGYALALLVMPFLQDKLGIDWYKRIWKTPDPDWAWQILDQRFKEKYADKLDPALFSEEELGLWAENYSSEDPDAVAKPMLDGIRLLHNYLKKVDGDTVVLFNIG